MLWWSIHAVSTGCMYALVVAHPHFLRMFESRVSNEEGVK